MNYKFKALLISLCVLPSILWAQEIKLGLQGGGNISNVRGQFGRKYDTQDKPGILLGIFVNKNISQSFSIAMEVNVSSKGFISWDSKSNKTHHNLTYIDVPLFANFLFAKRAGIFLGPNISFLLGDGYAGTLPVVFNRYNLALCVAPYQGIGKYLNLGFRYNHGLSKVVVPFSIDTQTSPDRLWQIFIQINVFRSGEK